MSKRKESARDQAQGVIILLCVICFCIWCCCGGR